MPCHRFMNHSNFIQFSCNSVSFSKFSSQPRSAVPPNVRAPNFAVVFQCCTSHPGAAGCTGPYRRHTPGDGDSLSENAHPQHVAVEAARNNLRVVRRTLKFLMAVQLREATRSMQMYLMNTGHLPALDMEFQDE